jgi:DNA-binding NtrC family response regulator
MSLKVSWDQALDYNMLVSERYDVGTLKMSEGERGPVPLAVDEVHLVVLEGYGQGREIPCGLQPVRIGSARDNDLVLLDPAVSRHHAVVRPEGGRFLLTDLGSTNGTHLGDVQVREAFLKPGQLIRVGPCILQLALRPRRAQLPLATTTTFGLLQGASPSMRQLFTVLSWVAPASVTLLISGPTGSGKELVARSIHQEGSRKTGPFATLDCGAVDKELISSEIFGHEAGAFTGAAGLRRGIFEQASGGTVFIDEIGELPLELQPKLLRVLEMREIRRLGGNATIPVDVRVVAASHRDLEAMVEQGSFREDLYYRLAQVKVRMPDLNERIDDLPLLAGLFAKEVSCPGITPDAISMLMGLRYPGNIRQLRNIITRAAVFARGSAIDAEHLSLLGDDVMGLTSARTVKEPVQAQPADERERILAALKNNDYNLTHTARELGMVVNTLKGKMQRLEIPRRVRIGRPPRE